MRWYLLPLAAFLLLWATGIYVQAIMKRQKPAVFVAMCVLSLVMASAALALVVEVR